MGKIQAFQVPGCECWIWTGDHHPPHFHAAAFGEWEIRVFFLQDPVLCETKFEIKRIPGRILRTILELAAEHRAELLEEWERSVADE